LVLPGQKKTVTNFLEDFGESGEVVRVAESW